MLYIIFKAVNLVKELVQKLNYVNGKPNRKDFYTVIKDTPLKIQFTLYFLNNFQIIAYCVFIAVLASIIIKKQYF